MSPEMPFQRPRLLAAIALLFAAGLVSVLYVKHASAVHALGSPPPDLARLIVQPNPLAAPAVGFSQAGGKRDALASFQGHFVLLNLWATWCGPCVGELPQLAKLSSAFPGLTVVAVNVGRDNAAETAAFLKSHGAAKLAVYVDSDSALLRAFETSGLPLSVLLDPKGREIARAVGPCEWGTAASVAYLRALTAAAPRASS
jgi:thiol-disulfide isomerase/thioredoxin